MLATSSYPTRVLQTWFDPSSMYILNPDETLGPRWRDGDVVQPGQVLDLDQWAIFDKPGEVYSPTFVFDARGYGLHWNTKHLVVTYDPANPPTVKLGSNGKSRMYVPINTPVKVSGGYQDVPSPKPGSARKKLEGYFTAELHQDNVPVRPASTGVSFYVRVPARDDRIEGFKVQDTDTYGWEWKDAAGVVIARNRGYPDRLSAKKARFTFPARTVRTAMWEPDEMSLLTNNQQIGGSA